MSIERSVAKLEAQQEAMAQDVSEMKSALTSIAQTLQDLSSMEQRQIHLAETVTRAHKRIDEIQAVLKDEVKNHEKRIQSIELNLAKNQWIERLVMAGVMTIIGLWIKSGI
jgi:predicted RNase H-like nuclease (RuvC/YqgF family)